MAHKVIYEAFYGDGKSGKYLEELGHNVIHEKIDFFDEQKYIKNINCFSNEGNEWRNPIMEFKKNSLSSIQKISENIASNIIEDISGDKLNESSIKASVAEISKSKMDKYL